MTTILTFNIILSTVVFATVVSLIAWAIATQHRDSATALVRNPRPGHRASRRRELQGAPARA